MTNQSLRLPPNVSEISTLQNVKKQQECIGCGRYSKGYQNIPGIFIDKSPQFKYVTLIIDDQLIFNSYKDNDRTGEWDSIAKNPCE